MICRIWTSSRVSYVVRSFISGVCLGIVSGAKKFGRNMSMSVGRHLGILVGGSVGDGIGRQGHREVVFVKRVGLGTQIKGTTSPS